MAEGWRLQKKLVSSSRPRIVISLTIRNDERKRSGEVGGKGFRHFADGST